MYNMSIQEPANLSQDNQSHSPNSVPMRCAKSNVRGSRQVCVRSVAPHASRLWFRHVTHTARCAADCHARLQIVNEVCDGCDEDEEDEDDEEDDDVALHGGGRCGVRK
jgi:hypothetical protein